MKTPVGDGLGRVPNDPSYQKFQKLQEFFSVKSSFLLISKVSCLQYNPNTVLWMKPSDAFLNYVTFSIAAGGFGMIVYDVFTWLMPKNL